MIDYTLYKMTIIAAQIQQKIPLNERSLSAWFEAQAVNS